MDDMIASISERFSGLDAAERLNSLKAVLLGVSAVASSRGIPIGSAADLGMLFDFRCRTGDSFTSHEDLTGLLAADEIALLPEEDQALAGNVLEAIAL
jgi:hypothetical protein